MRSFPCFIALFIISMSIHSVRAYGATYTVTASAGSGGTISPAGAITLNAGDSQTFTATAESDYSVEYWRVDGAQVQSGGTTYTMSNVQADHSLQVTFRINAPSNVSASKGIYCQKIRVTWDQVTGAESYEVWRKDGGSGNNIRDAGSGNSDFTQIGAVSGTTRYDDWSVHDPSNTYSYCIKTVIAAVTSDFSTASSGRVKSGPDLKVNDEDGPVTLPRGSEVVITAHINPQDSDVGAMRDWWIAAYTPAGWYNLIPGPSWAYLSDLSFIQPVAQCGLIFIPTRTLFETTRLSPGTYVFYFGVDPSDGILTTGNDLVYDSVMITIY